MALVCVPVTVDCSTITLCGVQSADQSYISSGNRIVLHFRSDFNVSASGFTATFTSFTPCVTTVPLGGTLTVAAAATSSLSTVCDVMVAPAIGGGQVRAGVVPVGVSVCRHGKSRCCIVSLVCRVAGLCHFDASLTRWRW